MIPSILLIADFGLLAIVIFFYLRRSLSERSFLRGAASRGQELQQKVYQIRVLQELGERIGYSLDTNKIIEIITSSIGSLLKYYTVSVMLFPPVDGQTFKCHVEEPVSRQFIDEVKEHMINAVEAICGRRMDWHKMEEQLSGTLIDDSLKDGVRSYVNVPVIIQDRLLALINVASTQPRQYNASTAAVLYSITNQAANAVSKLQNVLENEKGKLAGIIYAMTDGVMMVDLQNQLLVSNPAVKNILEIPDSQAMIMFDVIDALAGKVDLRTKIEEAILKDQPVVVPELFLKDKAVELTISPVKDRQGEKLGAAVILHDVTSEKSLEKLRQEFTAMMVHELRAPLTAVRWSSESLMKSVDATTAAPSAAKVKESVATIDTAAINMLELVNDLLDVAKIEAGKFDLNLQDYDLVSIIKDEVKTFQAQADMKHLGLSVTTPEKCQIKCDRVRISQVMTNLLSNAIKYSDSGEIHIDLTRDEAAHRVVVAIKDTGVGVSREDLGVLFSKFKQLKSVDRSRKGTGLGLVVSKGIVEAHGGQIWAESPGENLGSTFFFSLPIN